MIEKFNGIIYLIVFLVHFIGTGVYAFQLIVGTKKFRERFQIDETASHAPKIFKADCKILWSESAIDIHNKIRGLSPYPTAWTSVDKDKTLKLFKSTYENTNHNLEIGKVVITNNKELKVAANNGFVHIHELQLSGKKRMKTADFLRGYNFEDIILQ